jgi:predicted DNA binding CopG/RHH family protein
MPQDRESGARANKYGRETAQKIAEKVGAKSISKTSNEFELQDRKITIRCARHSTNSLGVTYKMMERIDYIFAALEQENGEYEIYEFNPLIFEKNMRETKSKGAAAGKVGLVRKIVFVNEGKYLRSVTI